MNKLNKLVEFAKKNHDGLSELSDKRLIDFFTRYQETTLVYEVNGEIRGFAVYQEWPDRLVFIAIAGTESIFENIIAGMDGRKKLPAKPICFFDEKKRKLRIFEV